MNPLNKTNISEQEVLERCREALADSSLFQPPQSQQENKLSKRKLHKIQVADLRKGEGIRASEEFKSYVAQQLSNSLDKNIEYDGSENNENDAECDFESGGIKLFHSSSGLITGQDLQVRKVEIGNKPSSCTKTLSDETLTNMAREAAVTPESVFNKEGTEHWAKPKGEVYHYRKNQSGILECAETS